jgi:hypothetical protein
MPNKNYDEIEPHFNIKMYSTAILGRFTRVEKILEAKIENERSISEISKKEYI